MKRFLLAAGLISLSLATLAAGGQQDSGVIKIGVAGAHSGDLASYGIPSWHAAQLVVDQVNAAGGIDGRRIELVVEDDVCDPGIAANTAAKLVGEGVVAVIGHICSGATKSALSIYQDSRIVTISPSATAVSFTNGDPNTGDKPYPNFFRTISPDDAQAELQVSFALDTLGLKKIAILHDRQDYGRGLAEFARAAVQKDGRAQVVLFEGITVGAVDYSAIINRVNESGADGVIYGGYHPEASKLVTQMKNKGMNIAFISDDGVKDQTFIDVAGSYAEGVYASGPIDTSTNPLAIQAAEAHRQKYGEEPGAFFLNAYAATQALLNAIDKADSTEYEAIMKALRSEYVETSLGNISFDEKGDAIGIGFSVYQVQNGEYVQVQ